MSEQTGWYYAAGTEQRGPVNAEQIRQMLLRGEITDDNLVWRDGMADWLPASSIPELRVAPPQPYQPQSIPPSPTAAPQPPPYSPAVPYAALPPELQQLQSKASTAMVVGIISIVLSGCCGPVGLGLGIWAWTSGSKIPPGYPFSGQGKAGFVCGIIGTILGGLASLFHFMWFLRGFAPGFH